MEQIYYVAFYFAIYSILGWCTEVVFYTVNYGKYVNRGFLIGPMCPIYGIGFCVVLAVLLPFKDNLLLLYLGSVILTTIVEFITGYILEKVFLRKWWDYSEEPFNLKGYVCLKFSLMWGFACIFILHIVQPAIDKFIASLPIPLGYSLLLVFYVVFLVDFIITILTVLNIKKRIKILLLIEEKLKLESELIGENLSDGVTVLLKATEKATEKGKRELSELKDKRLDELVSLKEKYEYIVNIRNKGTERIMKAFPRLGFLKNNDILEKLKTYLNFKK